MYYNKFSSFNSTEYVLESHIKFGEEYSQLSKTNDVIYFLLVPKSIFRL